MVIRYAMVLAVLVLALFLVGCSRPAATVDGKGITRERLDMYMKDRLREHKLQQASVDEKKLREAILQELIGEQLSFTEAEAKGIKITEAEVDKEIDQLRKRLGEEQYAKALKDKDLTPEAYRSRMREKLILARLVESFVKPEEITEQELQEAYKNSSRPFLKPARVNMKIVEFQAEDAANAAASEIKKSKLDFDEYAKKLDTEKKASVTDYGWVSPEFFSPAMAASVKMLKEGQHGGPYKGKTGFYLVRVRERENESVSTFEEVKETIRSSMLQEKRNNAYLQWLTQKRNSAKIVVNVK